MWKRLTKSDSLQGVFMVCMALGWIGMAVAVSAEPLLSAGDPFEQTEPPADATMLIEVQEYTEPPPEEPLVLQNEEHHESPSAPKEETSPQQPEAAVVPEPSSLLLVGLGILVGLWIRKRMRR
jgi:hypothetical protein